MKENIKIDEKIQARYSPRAYSPKNISKSEIDTLFEATRWAASSRNEQPWRFIYATPDNAEHWDKLFDCLIDFNKEWVKTAPFLMMVLAQKTNPEKNTERKHVAYDIGLAMGNFTYQASAMGLYLRNMGGFSDEKARENFNIPEIYEPIVMVAVGYLGKESDLEKHLTVPKANDRDRKTHDAIIYEGNWNKLK